jgi:hypothetical protein
MDVKAKLLNWFGYVVFGSGSHTMLGERWDCDLLIGGLMGMIK